jgi:hypothetical protein
MKINKITILMGVVGLVYGTSSNAFYNVNAALTAPTNWNWGYIYNATQDLFRLTNNNGSNYGWPGFVKVSASGYNNYSWNSETGHFDDGDSSNDPTLPQTILPNGLNVEMKFNRSNTTWFDFTNPDSDNYPYSFADDTKIGSNNTVGTIADKWFLKFDNQTNRDYRLYLDRSSSPASGYTFAKYDGTIYGGVFNAILLAGSGNLNTLLIPSFTTLEWYIETTATTQYIDAWYLQDLGISEAWQNGYDDGYTDGENDMVLTGGLPGLIANIFDALTGIMNVNIFGDITFGGLLLFPIVITLFVFIMKMVKAGT